MAKRHVEWRGSFPAIMTPFTAEGDLDEELIRANVRMTLDEGAHGLVICGHNGEAHLMNDEERLRVVALAVAEVAGKVPVIAGTGHIGTREVIHLSQAAREIGADGVMIEPPYFMTPKPADIIAHYARVSDAVDMPILLYNNPNRAGVDLTPAIVDALADLDNVVAIKDSNGDFVRIMHLLQGVGERIRVFVGPARLYGFAGVLMGASGFVDGLPQVAGRRAIELFELAAAGDTARGVPLQHDLFRVGQILYHSAGTYPATIKDAMRILGRPGGYPRSPLRPMGPEDLKKLEDGLASVGLTAVGSGS